MIRGLIGSIGEDWKETREDGKEDTSREKES